EEHKKLELLAFESETRIASLEEEITATLKEKEEVISINDGLMLELEGLTEKMNTSTSELYNLTEEISTLNKVVGQCIVNAWKPKMLLNKEKQRLEESDINQENLKSSIKVLMEEKEELAMQLTDSLLEIEEERAIWSAKEKAALLAIEEQTKEECRTVQERLTITYENSHIKENFSGEHMISGVAVSTWLRYLLKTIFDSTWQLLQGKVSKWNQLDNCLENTDADSKQSLEMSKANSEMQSLDNEVHGRPDEEKENEMRNELHVHDKGYNLSSPNEYQ
ncbi:unnamed protein product, partial [Sphenostylis stenocarpa]